MIKSFAAVAAVVAAFWGTSADAREVSRITWVGSFNDNYVFQSFVATMDVDTSLGEVVPFEDGYELRWNASMDGPSPTDAIYVRLGTYDDDGAHVPREELSRRWNAQTQFVVGAFSNFSLKVSSHHYAIQVFNPNGGEVQIGLRVSPLFFGHPGTDSFPVFPGTVPGLTDSFSRTISNPGDYGRWSVGDSPMPLTSTVSVERIAVPEPTTWALMILGFGAAGTALRRRQRLTA